MGSISGSCSLLIRGNTDLDFQEIEGELSLSATNVAHKGEVKYKLAGECKADVWVHSVEFEEDERPEESLERFVQILLARREKVKMLVEKYDMCIRYFIQSELAQIGLDFSPELIRSLALLGLKLEISILSWGEVENNDEMSG